MQTLLLPCAGRSSRYPGVRPKWTLTAPDGRLAIAHAAASVEPGAVARRVIAIRADHEAQYGVRRALRQVFGEALDVVVLDEDTRGPAETVALMIERAEVRGPIAIKDADSFFDPITPPAGHSIALVDLKNAPDLTRVGSKSFAILNEQHHLAGIVEKQVSSNYVSAGLYCFGDAAGFLEYFRTIEHLAPGEIFVSHVISEALRQGEPFATAMVDNMVDVGTLTEWRRYVVRQQTLLVDIDGVVFENQSAFFAPFWGDPVKPIQRNLDHLRRLQQGGAQLIFTTSRPEHYRQATLEALQAHGLSADQLVMGCRHAPRVLINDFSPTNPYPSASAINLARNAPDLDQLLS